MQSLPAASTKKPYQSPQLRVYGDIRQLTLLNGMGVGMVNNMIANFLKT